MTVGQSGGTGAKSELVDEEVRKNEILSNRDKAQRAPGRGLDGKGVQVDEYKDTPANRRPPKGENTDKEAVVKKVDRPGFDLGGATGKTDAGKGLGLGDDVKKGKKGWGLPR